MFELLKKQWSSKCEYFFRRRHRSLWARLQACSGISGLLQHRVDRLPRLHGHRTRRDVPGPQAPGSTQGFCRSNRGQSWGWAGVGQRASGGGWECWQCWSRPAHVSERKWRQGRHFEPVVMKGFSGMEKACKQTKIKVLPVQAEVWCVTINLSVKKYFKKTYISQWKDVIQLWNVVI